MYKKYDGHTEGPWKINDRDKNNITTAIEDGISKADFPLSIMMPCMSFAWGDIGMLISYSHVQDAQLIADAPMLLEQNKKMLNLLCRVNVHVFDIKKPFGIQIHDELEKLIKEIEEA